MNLSWLDYQEQVPFQKIIEIAETHLGEWGPLDKVERREAILAAYEKLKEEDKTIIKTAAKKMVEMAKAVIKPFEQFDLSDAIVVFGETAIEISRLEKMKHQRGRESCPA